MFKFQLIPFLPFIALILNFLTSLSTKKSLTENLRNKISLFFAALLIIGGISVRNLDQSLTINLFNLSNGFSFELSLHSSCAFLIEALGIFWFLLAVYSDRYFSTNQGQSRSVVGSQILIVVGFLSAIILSKNFLTALLFYQLLALTSYLVAKYHSTPKGAKSVNNFGIFLIGSSSLLFLAVALIFKISGQMDFVFGGIFNSAQMPVGHFGKILIFLAISILSIAFTPFYLFFNKLYSLKPPIIILTLVSFGFAILSLFFKIIIGIFGIKFFANLFEQINHYNSISIILGFNLLVSAVFALLSSNLKQILTLLFFNQLILAIFAFLTFGLGYKQMQIVILSFVFSQVLIFICVGNINLYLKNSGTKSLSGIFRALPLSSLAFIFALLSFVGLVPALPLFEKYYLFKNIWQSEDWIHATILIANVGTCFLCVIKIIYPMLVSTNKRNNSDFQIIAKNEARKIERNLSLTLPMLLIPLILFVFSFPPIFNFFIK